MLDRSLMQSALRTLEGLRNDLLAARSGTDTNHPRSQSFLNLRQYLILRSKDWTELQEQLFLLSLSSLGRSYAHVAASVDTLYDQLASSLGKEQISAEEMAAFHHLSIAAAQETLSRNSRALFGTGIPEDPKHQTTAVMVTLPSHAADDGGKLIRDLAEAGVNVFRINTAHDTLRIWQAMADTIAALNMERPSDRKLKIFVDLAGPKIRTGTIRRIRVPIKVGSNKREKPVILRPESFQTRAQTVDPSTLRTLPAELALERSFFETLRKGDVVKVTGVNGKHARIVITECEADRAVGVISKKIAVDETSTVSIDGRSSRVLHCVKQPDTIRLFRGDILQITENDVPGRSARSEGDITTPASIPCTLPGFASHVRVGERVFIDDGKIGLVVREVDANTVRCEVLQAKPGGTLLKEEKGINLPDSHLKIPALTALDREHLLQVKDFADMLGLSFCQSAEDVETLQACLRQHDAAHIGIVPKIETRQGVAAVPRILGQLLQWEKSGIMIARGDLAIEVGFVNLASIQQSLLDICMAAHIPVIWATQVLESQMKNNLPSRAEITDAAMAGRAECVMLNKGPFAVDTAGTLLRILRMMHQSFWKNRQLLCKESLWEKEAADDR